LGDDLPADFKTFLIDRGEDPVQFSLLVMNLVEIVFDSFYTAANNERALEYLARVIELTAPAGVKPPPAELFATSPFTARGGWGPEMTASERDRWRNIASRR
jgi:hypothetical protein